MKENQNHAPKCCAHGLHRLGLRISDLLWQGMWLGATTVAQVKQAQDLVAPFFVLYPARCQVVRFPKFFGFISYVFGRVLRKHLEGEVQKPSVSHI